MLQLQHYRSIQQQKKKKKLDNSGVSGGRGRSQKVVSGNQLETSFELSTNPTSTTLPGASLAVVIVVDRHFSSLLYHCYIEHSEHCSTTTPLAWSVKECYHLAS